MLARITLTTVILSVCAFFTMGQQLALPPVSSSPQEINLHAKTATVYGIDVSHFQGDINWNQVKQNRPKISFVFIKATESTDIVDPHFQNNWQGAKEAGILRGAYHYFEADKDPHVQAELFIDTVQRLEENDLPPWLDLERGKYSKVAEASKSTFVNNVFIWLEEVESALGVKPVIYASPDFARDHLTDERFSNYTLAVAEYGLDSASPRMLGAWEGLTWAFWQYFPQRLIKGITEKTDLDKFNGSVQDLLNFAKNSRQKKGIYAALEKEKELALAATKDKETTDVKEDKEETETPELQEWKETTETPEVKQEIVTPTFTEEINIGKTHFPRDFIHKQKDYKKGAYQVKLVLKDEGEHYYFLVHDDNNQLIFEEMALVIPRKGKYGKFKPRIKKSLLPGREYFMIKVTKPDQYLYAFFYVKK